MSVWHTDNAPKATRETILSGFFFFALYEIEVRWGVNTLNAELNPICYLLALLTHNFFHVSRIYIWSAYS